MRADDLVAIAIDPLATAAPAPMTALTVMVDSSASRALGYAAQLEDLATMIAAVARAQGGALPLVVGAFDQDVQEIYRGRADGFGADAIARLRGRAALGASDLAGALRWAGGGGGGGGGIGIGAVAPTACPVAGAAAQRSSSACRWAWASP